MYDKTRLMVLMMMMIMYDGDVWLCCAMTMYVCNVWLRAMIIMLDGDHGDAADGDVKLWCTTVMCNNDVWLWCTIVMNGDNVWW